MNKSEEYTSLRSEIISLVDIQYNYILAMYTISIAIISLAIQQQNEWIFLLPYIILFSFQRVITAKRFIMLRLAAYIAVFLDEDFGWEKNYNDIVDHTLKKHNRKKKFSWLKNIISGRISSLQLGVVCSVGCIIVCFRHIVENYGWDNAKNVIWIRTHLIQFLPVICAFLLLAALFDWCRGAVDSMEVRAKYIESLTQYKNDIESNENIS